MSENTGVEDAIARLSKTVGAIVAIVTAIVGLVSLAQQHLWIVIAIIFVLAICVAAYVYFSKALYARWVRRLALGALILLPTAALTALVTWQFWLQVPPSNTRILVATFVDKGSGNDTRAVTPMIMETLRDQIDATPGKGKRDDVLAVPLGQEISPMQEDPNKLAISKALSQKASIVVWGWYSVAGDEVDVHPHTEIVRSFKLDRAGKLSESETELTASAQDLNKALEKEFKYIAASIVGLARYNASDYLGSQNALTLAIKDIPPNPAVEPDVLYYYRSNDDERLGDLKASLSDIQEAVRRNDTEPLNWTNEGVAYFNAGQIRRALNSYGQALQRDPSNSVAQFNNALAREIYWGDYKNAYNTYLNLAGMTPVEVWDWRFKGQAAERLGDYDRACHALFQAVGSEPSLSDVRARYADCLYHMGKFQTAIGEYTRALTLDQDNEGILYSRAVAYNALGNAQAAKLDFQEIFAKTAKTATDHLNRALALQQLGRLKEAANEYTTVINDNAYSVTALRQRSYLESARGDYAGAAADLRRVIAIGPDNEGDLVNLAGVLHKARRSHDANAFFSRLSHLGVAGYKGHESLADAFLTRHDIPRAIAEYRRAVGMNEFDGYAYLFLGYCEGKVGATDDAAKDFLLASRYLPYDPIVDSRLGSNFRDPSRLDGVASAYLNSGELYRRLGLSTDDDRIQE